MNTKSDLALASYIAKLETNNAALLEVLEAVQQACLFDDDSVPSKIGVTFDPHIHKELFNQICAAIKTAKTT